MPAPRRERLPDTRQSITHKFNIAGHEGYITVGLYPDGRPGELFITMAKEGSTIGGLMDCFGTAVSMSLQYGVPLEVYVNKFSHTRFEPMGLHEEPRHPIAKSIVDYIFRWLGITFLPGYGEMNKAVPVSPAEAGNSSPGRRERRKQSFGPSPRRPAGRATGKERPRRRSQGGQRLPLPTATAATARTGQWDQWQRRAAVAKKPAAAADGGRRRRQRRDAPRGLRPADPQAAMVARHEQFASFQTDAPQLRPLRGHHRPRRKLLPLLQLRQQHGLFVNP